MVLLKWDYTLKGYVAVDLPEGNYKAYSSDMNEIINCPHCGKELEFGDGYTSYEFQTQMLGFGYCVCEECYKKEVEEKGYMSIRRKTKMPIKIANQRIVKLNVLNWVIEEYKEVISPDGSKRMDWMQGRGYYNSLQGAAKAVRRNLINQAANKADIDSVDKLIKYLDEFEEIEVEYIEREQKSSTKSDSSIQEEDEEEADF